ncbi:hypothetical protein LZ30DRAFT_70642 [Colletotrichum cereale]|nr:hypothetical protein LZ30DRAFT_70642 [Colletotrichum cereale]
MQQGESIATLVAVGSGRDWRRVGPTTRPKKAKERPKYGADAPGGDGGQSQGRLLPSPCLPIPKRRAGRGQTESPAQRTRLFPRALAGMITKHGLDSNGSRKASLPRGGKNARAGVVE